MVKGKSFGLAPRISLRSGLLCLGLLALAPAAAAQTVPQYTRADSIRGSLTAPERTWWDVTFYDLYVEVNPADSSIAGWNAITYRVVEEPKEMQIDLQAPLVIDSVVQNGRRLPVRQDGDAWFVRPAGSQPIGSVQTVTVYYHGKPRVAPNPPWDGGFTWTKDAKGRPWVSTSNQGLGASVWWPNKDIGWEEPDSQRVAIRVPDPMIHVGNGRLRDVVKHDDGTTTYVWFVANPINNYGIAVNAGSYAHFEDVFEGELGTLTMDFWPLDYNLEAAKRQWAQAKEMLACFEHWFGPYPWYEDGYKLVEVPYLGMEHQSAVTYGNGYQNGYRGRDMSGTGRGADWDFIIIHESAHEWFANNITGKDRADMWVHESFTTYAEGLFVECRAGKEAGAEYIRGIRRNIRNDRPIIPDYGVNAQGSGDMYPKGANMIHMIRRMLDDDVRWRSILRGMNKDFWHSTVSSAQIEAYLIEKTGLDLRKVFDQYLRTADVPVFEYRIDGRTLHYRWTNVVPGFDMPVEVTLSDGGYTKIRPTESWQTATLSLRDPSSFSVHPDYYVDVRRVEGSTE